MRRNKSALDHDTAMVDTHSIIGRILLASKDHVFLIGPLCESVTGFLLPIVFKSADGVTRETVQMVDRREAEQIRWQLISTLAFCVPFRSERQMADWIARRWPASIASSPRIAARIR